LWEDLILVRFADVERALTILEQSQFDNIKKKFRWSEVLQPHIRGSIQCFAVDKPKGALVNPLPVVCAVGINYTQNGRCSTDDLFRYEEPSVGVVRSTASTAAVVSVVAAYERNRHIWASRKPVDPESPMGFYGSPNAITKTGLIANGGFILIMTNICPFITMTEWAKEPQHVSKRLVQESKAYRHLDDLYDALGGSIDLWIGHSALGGTQWVWPAFSSFVRRRGIKEWLLTANISPRSHLWFEGAFRERRHRLFPWYGPEKIAPAPLTAI
jgi:hypothetical protein